ncbi:hypothetical protein [Mucilaginibacter sp.]|nr:hypothetical protein [Mucilaginibacter sp.]MDR3697419.1 hypothetical protein [Mucilaginibacter sp.]
MKSILLNFLVLILLVAVLVMCGKIFPTNSKTIYEKRVPAQTTIRYIKYS